MIEPMMKTEERDKLGKSPKQEEEFDHVKSAAAQVQYFHQDDELRSSEYMLCRKSSSAKRLQTFVFERKEIFKR